MLVISKFRNAYYRRFKEDIWGFLITNTSIRRVKVGKRFKFTHKNWLLKFFYRIEKARFERWLQRKRRYVYRIDINAPTKRTKKLKIRFVTVRLTRLYFLTLKDHQFRKIFRRAAFLDGNLEDNYLHAIEGRLVAFLYRCNFFKNIFEILDIIKQGVIYVDKKVINVPNYKVPVSKFVTINYKWHKRLKYDWIKRTQKNSWMFSTPQYIYTSFLFYYAYLLTLPKRKYLVYPFKIDIQRLTGYY